MMKKRIFAAALAACLSLAPMQAFAGAARILPSVTVNMHGNSGLTCTMTDVLSYYKPTHIAFYFAENGTISFNQEVELLIGWHTRLGQHEFKRLQPGEKYTVSDAPGSKSDGLSGQVFLNTGDASFLFSAPIVYVYKGERRVENSTLRRLLTFSDEELKENNIYPLADIAVGGLPPEPAAASPTAQPLLVNGQRVSGMEAYNIGGYNYFKLRDLAQVLNGTEKQFDVDWDAERNAISLAYGKPYTPVGGELEPGAGDAADAIPATAAIYLDGRPVTLAAYNINGNNYFKLRDIGETLYFHVSYDEATKTMAIDTSKGYAAGGA